MKKLSLIITALLFTFALAILGSPELHAATTMNSAYIYDAATNTHGGLTYTIEEGTNTFTLNGTASNSSWSLPGLYTPNTNGSVLNTTKAYAVVYEYISGTVTGGSSMMPIKTGTTAYSDVYSGSSVYITASNYNLDQTYTLLPNDATMNAIQFTSGTLDNLKYRIHFIELADIKQNDVNVFSSSNTFTSGTFNISIASGNTVTLTGSTSAEVYVNISSVINPVLINSDDLYLFTFEYVSGTIGTGYALRPFVLHQDTSKVTYNMSAATQSYSRGTGGSNIGVYNIGAVGSMSYTSYVYKINTQKIELYTETVENPGWTQAPDGYFYLDTTTPATGASLEVTSPFAHGMQYRVTRNGSLDTDWTTLPASVTITKTAATFGAYSGYHLEITGTDFTDTISAVDTDTIVLEIREYVAVWSVTFNSDGGSAITAQSIENSKLATEPTAPTKAGYNFTGWVLDGTSTAYDFATPVTADVTLLATWESNGVTVFNIVFVENGGSVMDDMQVEDGSIPAEPADPTRSGYTFGGWYSDIALTTPYAFDVAVTADMMLYAKWTPVEGGGDPIDQEPDASVSSSTWLYIGLGAAVLAVAIGSSIKAKKGKRR